MKKIMRKIEEILCDHVTYNFSRYSSKLRECDKATGDNQVHVEFWSFLKLTLLPVSSVPSFPVFA